MKLLPGILFMAICAACNPAKEKPDLSATITKQVVRHEFQQIIDSANVTGSVLIYDPQKLTWFSNDFERSKKGFLPASTFKIPNSIIALETGVVNNDSTLFKWDGKKRRLAVWEQDLTFREAFHVSCVPCYQEIARKIGVQRMKEYLEKMKYGTMVVDPLTIDKFWLEGESRISQFQQIEFLVNFYNWNLPVGMRTFAIMKRLMVIDKNEKYTLSGKTGWAIRNENNYGWFVGYLEQGEDIYFIATNIEPKETFNMDFFPKIRSEISLKAIEMMIDDR